MVLFVVAYSRNSTTVCNLKAGMLLGAKEDIYAWEGRSNRRDKNIVC